MEDVNIFIKNGMGSGKKTIAHKKISGKSSIARNKNTMNMSLKVKSAFKGVGNVASDINKGNSSIVSKTVGKLGKVGVVVGALMTLGNKTIGMVINYNEAQTGDKLRAHNSRVLLNTATSFGMNYVYGAIRNEIFTKNIISRQNFALDYGRELYQINVEGTKNKRI